MKCEICDKEILTMTFKGSGVCGDICRKVKENGDGPSSETAGGDQPNVEGDRIGSEATEPYSEGSQSYDPIDTSYIRGSVNGAIEAGRRG